MTLLDDRQDTRRHVAQANIAWLRYPIDDPRIAEFREGLTLVNEAADDDPGLVWRLQTDEGDSTAIRVLDDPSVLFNLSVWRSLEALYRFTYAGRHLDYFRDRARWFRKPRRKPVVVLWWVHPGALPTVEEALLRFEEVWGYGPGPAAFTFQECYSAEGQLIDIRDHRPTHKIGLA